MQAELTPRRGGGFTLVEMAITIAVMGVVAVTIGMFIVPAVTSYEAMQRRAGLVDAAESALRRMARDIRISVPNSLRVTNTASGFAIEMVPTVDGVRYCAAGTADCNETLLVTQADLVWDVLGCHRNAAVVGGSGGPAGAFRFVVANTGPAIYSATTKTAAISDASFSYTLSTWPGPGACGTASATPGSFNRHRVTLSPGPGQVFPLASPRQRMFVVQNAVVPVTYVCNTTAGTLTRYAGYKNGAALSTVAQPTDPLAPPLSTASEAGVVTSDVTACAITSSATNVETNNVVTLSITVSRAGESVSLLSQVQLDNSI